MPTWLFDRPPLAKGFGLPARKDPFSVVTAADIKPFSVR
jgi:hypothetical protein